jgi:hypothetical protein
VDVAAQEVSNLEYHRDSGLISYCTRAEAGARCALRDEAGREWSRAAWTWLDRDDERWSIAGTWTLFREPGGFVIVPTKTIDLDRRIDDHMTRAVYRLSANPLYGTAEHRWLDDASMMFVAATPGRECLAVAAPVSGDVAHVGCWSRAPREGLEELARGALASGAAEWIERAGYWDHAARAELRTPTPGPTNPPPPKASE